MKKLVSILLILIFFVCIIVNTNAISIVDSHKTIIGSNLKDKIVNLSEEEKLPVYIWYEDINQDEIDYKLNEELGYDKFDIKSDMKLLSNKELYDIGKDDFENDVLNNYLESNKLDRQKEQEKTNRYINKRREFSREAYNEKSNKIMEDLDVNDEDIVFNSQYAPMIIVNLDIKHINKCINSDIIKEIDVFNVSEVIDCNTDTIKEVSGRDKVLNKLGLTGEGVKIGVIESGGLPQMCSELENTSITEIGTLIESGHAQNTARILVGEDNGFVTGAELYCTNSDFENIETLLTYGVIIINCSFGWVFYESNNSLSYAYSIYDKWFDHVVKQHNVTVVCSAGNNAQGTLSSNGVDIYKRILSPAMAQNVITVGAYSDRNTIDVSDDQLESYSSYKNSNGTPITSGIEKPDIVQDSNILGGGTSSSAPVMTALIAQILEYRPSLAVFPQVIKAIVLASCHRKALPSTDGESSETMTQGITERQGAGIPNVWNMLCIVSQNTYGAGILCDGSSMFTYRFIQPAYNASNINVSLTWLKNNISEENHTNNSFVDGENIDLDLTLYTLDNECLGSSLLEKSSTELIYTPLSSLINGYKMRVDRYDNNGGDVYFGFAYNLDNTYLQSNNQSGIYQIVNADTNRYLSYSNNNIVMSSYSNSNNKKWILRDNLTNINISSLEDSIIGNISHGEIVENIDNSISAYNVSMSNNQTNLIMNKWDFNLGTLLGTYNFIDLDISDSEDEYCLSNYNGVFFCNGNTNNNWRLEKINYRVGDVNGDGVFETLDVQRIQRMLAEQISLNKMESFLADANNDNIVDVLDSMRIQQILVGLREY